MSVNMDIVMSVNIDKIAHIVDVLQTTMWKFIDVFTFLFTYSSTHEQFKLVS